ncbi:MAG: hypothetical protein WCS77_08125 [Elusimicrobiaceae bacterium]
MFNIANLQNLVKEYKTHQTLDKQLKVFRKLKFDEAFDYITLTHKNSNPGQIFPHFRRRWCSHLKNWGKNLKNEKTHIKQCKNFEEILSEVRNNISGEKPLYKYDVALRLGANIGHMPKMVYLHAGTEKGARNLGFQHATQTLIKNDFDKHNLSCLWSSLKPYQIEDFLCIYKECFLCKKSGRCNDRIKKFCC